MLYHITLKFQFPKDSSISNNTFYYAILWWVLNFLNQQQELYHKLVKISFSKTAEVLYIYVVIHTEKAYRLFIDTLLRRKKEELSINGITLQFDALEYATKTFSFEETFQLIRNKSSLPKKFLLKFLSPTFIRQQKITFVLPTPERFLFSLYQKCKKYFSLGSYDDDTYKKRLEHNIYIWEYKLKSDIVHIKQWIKAWSVGYCTYYLNAHDEQFSPLLFTSLHAASFVGIGNGTKLWLGNVKVIYS